jgi:hypothetical protein
VRKDASRDLIHKVQEGLKSQGNLSTASGDPRSGKTVAKHDYLWVIHQRKCKAWQKGGLYSRLASDEITSHGYRALPLQHVQVS